MMKNANTSNSKIEQYIAPFRADSDHFAFRTGALSATLEHVLTSGTVPGVKITNKAALLKWVRATIANSESMANKYAPRGTQALT